MTPTPEQIQEMNCEIARLLGWTAVSKHKHSGALIGVRFVNGEGYKVGDLIPNYLGDLSLLLGEFAEWLSKWDIEIKVACVSDRFKNKWSVQLFVPLPVPNVLGRYQSPTPQEAAYHALVAALPRIKEIVGNDTETK